jgi:hypothetical protein
MTQRGDGQGEDEKIGRANRDRGLAMHVAIRTGDQKRQRDRQAGENEAIDDDGCAMANACSHSQAGLTSDVHAGQRVAFNAIFE